MNQPQTDKSKQLTQAQRNKYIRALEYIRTRMNMLERKYRTEQFRKDLLLAKRERGEPLQ